MLSDEDRPGYSISTLAARGDAMLGPLEEDVAC